MLHLEDSNTRALSIIQDPFKKDKIKRIHFHMGYGRPNEWIGSVEFQNGDTSGEQSIKPTDDFNNAVLQIRAIIDSLK